METKMPARKRISLEEEYSKPTGITADDIAKLRQWLDTQPHLPKNLTDLDLILIYHKCDRSIQVSKQEIDNQYTLRTLFTSFFKDRSLNKDIENFFLTALVTILPNRSKAGDAIFYARILDTDVNKFDFASAIKGVFMMLDLWQYEEGTWPGLTFIFDLQGIKMGLLSKLDIQNIQQFVAYFPDAILAKFNGLHFINTPTFMDRVNTLTKAFYKNENIQKFIVHQNGSNTLEQIIDIDILPKEAGGKFKSLEECQQDTLEKIRANEDYFVEENKKRIVEALRPGKPKTIADFFDSVEGSFKKLEID
ncbi:clavesin-1 isoform X2 [Bombyx mori]|uniref:CRAL-TRIO domain-containing protein n=1 Tax=Bombyx mori TaxID=7091 RepID=A0A8R1WHM2_BOMMO|nr:clavesin-1 isoform X1 [Bombyx mori]